MTVRPFAIALSLAALIGAAHAAVPAASLVVPRGFQVELLTDAVPGARAMALGRFQAGNGTVFVGSSGAGKVYAVEIAGGRAGAVHTIASGLDVPAGIAWRAGSLYSAQTSRILRFDGIDDRLADPPAPVVVTDKLPSESHHGVKTIAFGPDDKLYVSIGSPCNVCVPDAAHGVIRRMNLDGSGMETVASGIRNSVGFDWSPVDRALWFTDNGRDMLGDDVPGDELNRVQKPGQAFGFPYCHQGNLPDPQFGSQRKCAEFTAPAAVFGAHVAALGMRFYDGEALAGASGVFPAAYRHSVFIAQRGSWNRSRKSGYQVVRAVLDERGSVARVEPFVTGFLTVDGSGAETVLGRPTDVLVLPDGSLLVSDERGGALYRVTYRGPATAHASREGASGAAANSTTDAAATAAAIPTATTTTPIRRAGLTLPITGFAPTSSASPLHEAPIP